MRAFARERACMREWVAYTRMYSCVHSSVWVSTHRCMSVHVCSSRRCVCLRLHACLCAHVRAFAGVCVYLSHVRPFACECVHLLRCTCICKCACVHAWYVCMRTTPRVWALERVACNCVFPRASNNAPRVRNNARL